MLVPPIISNKKFKWCHGKMNTKEIHCRKEHLTALTLNCHMRRMKVFFCLHFRLYKLKILCMRCLIAYLMWASLNEMSRLMMIFWGFSWWMKFLTSLFFNVTILYFCVEGNCFKNIFKMHVDKIFWVFI